MSATNDFWLESSQLALQLAKDANKKKKKKPRPDGFYSAFQRQCFEIQTGDLPQKQLEN